MTDVAAATSEVSAPVSEAPAQTTADIAPIGDNPVHSEPTPDKPLKVEVVTPKPKTAMDSLKEAQAKSDRNEKDRIARETAKVETKAPEAPKLDDKGQPIVEAKVIKHEPPARWTPSAKAKWEALDEEVKSESARTFKELENGMNTYKERASKMDELKEFEDIAKQYKTDIKTALSNYVTLDKSLQSENPAEKLSALDQVFAAAKVDKVEFARFILGIGQDEYQQPNRETNRETNREMQAMQQDLAQLRQQVHGNTQFAENQQRSQVESQITQWARDKPHADALAPQIAAHVHEGFSLDDAYTKAVTTQQEIARQMGFVSPPATTAPAPTQTQTLKGLKSISGTPSSGSYQATQKPSSSNIEAVRKAMEAAGISL